jgi:hypothetical protein
MDIKTPAPDSQSATAMPAALKPELLLILQSFPRVAEEISRLWGTIDLQDYLNQTIFDERGGRQGFPVPVVMALERIFEDHSKLFPQAIEDPFWDGMAK